MCCFPDLKCLGARTYMSGLLSAFRNRMPPNLNLLRVSNFRVLRKKKEVFVIMRSVFSPVVTTNLYEL